MYKPPVARSQLTKAEWLGGYIWAGHNMIVTMQITAAPAAFPTSPGEMPRNTTRSTLIPDILMGATTCCMRGRRGI